MSTFGCEDAGAREWRPATGAGKNACAAGPRLAATPPASRAVASVPRTHRTFPYVDRPLHRGLVSPATSVSVASALVSSVWSRPIAGPLSSSHWRRGDRADKPCGEVPARARGPSAMRGGFRGRGHGGRAKRSQRANCTRRRSAWSGATRRSCAPLRSAQQPVGGGGQHLAEHALVIGGVLGGAGPLVAAVVADQGFSERVDASDMRSAAVWAAPAGTHRRPADALPDLVGGELVRAARACPRPVQSVLAHRTHVPTRFEWT